MEGIFRLSGSAKRIKDLQTVFNSPDRYGKGLDWTGYTVHDAANILRRYLNQLPEPIVPLDFYERFRSPLQRTQRLGSDGENQPRDLSVTEHSAAVAAYQKLITELPPLNRQLLLYILDLLAVFASKADLNRMTAANLAAIFQPGIISHPIHDMAPLEYRLSQDVLIFLIENQDNFLIGMSGTAVDEKTQKDVESGPPSLRSSKPVGRSTSNASAGADSLRKFGVRRNVSVSSRGSRERSSPGVSSPGTPSGVNSFTASAVGAGIARSNTLPSKRSPAITSSRFQRVNDNSESGSTAVTPTVGSIPIPSREGADSKSSRSASIVPEDSADGRKKLGMAPNIPAPDQPWEGPSQPTSAADPAANLPSQVLEQGSAQISAAASTQSSTRDRKMPNLFSKSPIFGPSDPARPPKKLQKRQKIPGSVNDSAQSSMNSLHGEEANTFYTPLVSPDINAPGQSDPLGAPQAPALINTAATPVNEMPSSKQFASPFVVNNEEPNLTGGLKPPTSPPVSTHSRSSFTDHSDADVVDDTLAQPDKERRHRWRFSSSAKKGESSPLVPPPPIGQNTGARGSNSSFGSGHRPRKSFTVDSQQSQQSQQASGEPLQPQTGIQPVTGHTSQELPEASKEPSSETEKKGFLTKWKAKMSQSREERQAEKERAKSPPRTENGASRSSLTAFAQEHLAPRGRSMDKSRDDGSERAGEGPPPGRNMSTDAGQGERTAE